MAFLELPSKPKQQFIIDTSKISDLNVMQTFAQVFGHEWVKISIFATFQEPEAQSTYKKALKVMEKLTRIIFIKLAINGNEILL